MVTTHFHLVSGPFWAPGGPKRAIWPRYLNFHGPILWGTFFCFKYRLVGCPEHRSGMPYSSSTVIAHLEPPSSRKRSKTGKKGPFRPEMPLLGLWEGPEGPDFVPTAPNWPALDGLMLTTHFDLVSAPSGPPGTLKGPVSARNAPFGALGGPRGARFGPDCPRLARLGWTHAHHTLWPGIGPLLGPWGS